MCSWLFFLTIRQSEVKKILMRPHIPHKVFQYLDRGVAPAQYKETEEEQLKSPCRWMNQHPRDTRGLWWCLLMQTGMYSLGKIHPRLHFKWKLSMCLGNIQGILFGTDGWYSNFRDRKLKISISGPKISSGLDTARQTRCCFDVTCVIFHCREGPLT